MSKVSSTPSHSTPSMDVLNVCDTDEQRIAKLSEALDDLAVAYRASLRPLRQALTAVAESYVSEVGKDIGICYVRPETLEQVQAALKLSVLL